MRRILLYTILIIITPFLSNKGDNILPYVYERGNEFYIKGDYKSALQAFHEALDEMSVLGQRYPWIYFKIGFCQYKIEDYQNAVRTFENNSSALQIVNDYVEYFLYRSKLSLGDTVSALNGFSDFLKHHPHSPIVPLVDSLYAEISYQQKNYKIATIYYQKQLKYPYFDKGDIYWRLIEIKNIIGRQDGIEDLAFKLIENHPFHPKSQAAYIELMKILGSQLPESKFRRLFKYVENTQQFEKANRLLRFQINSSGETEFTRWLKIELLYENEKYQEALQSCINQRKTFSQLRYLREIDLHIARCYLRLGHIEQSIEAYSLFQKRYPRDYLSPEVLWKIAWLFEEIGDYSMARQYYEKLNMTYPNSQFVEEARFRTGLNYYRENQFIAARIVWEKSLSLEKDAYEKPRYQYWIAKTYLKEKNFINYLREIDNLAKTPFLTYYNLKSFLLTTDNTETHQFVDSLLWEMHHEQSSHLGQFIDVLQRTLVVQEILGNIFARYELNNNYYNHSQSDWQYRYALAELQEKLGNYGKAYRLFRNVYVNFFSKKDWEQWIFLFKKLYPLYFDPDVTHHAEKKNITPEVLWAIIKKESAFEPVIISYANAYGLMQIIPPTARQIARELKIDFNDMRLLYNPDVNIEMGTYYITELLKRYEWNLYYALAAYNAGPHRVDRWQKIIDTSDDDFFMENIEFSETRKYVRVVMRYYWTYYLILHPQEIPDEVFSFPKKLTREQWYNDLKRN